MFLSLFHRSIVLVVATALCAGCPGDEQKEDATAKPTPATDTKPGPSRVATELEGKGPEQVRYDGTISGLERFMRDLRVSIQSDDEESTALLLASLRLASPSAFFSETFGQELGEKLSADYQPIHDDIGMLAALLDEQFEAGRTEPQVERFQTADVPTSTGYQSAALSKMSRTVPLYSVRLFKKGEEATFHLWSFVHHEGSFRYVGKMHGVAAPKKKGKRDLLEFRIQDAKRIEAAK